MRIHCWIVECLKCLATSKNCCSSHRAGFGGLLLGTLLLTACGGDSSPTSIIDPAGDKPGTTNSTTNPVIAKQDPATSTRDPAIVVAPLESVASSQSRNLAPAVSVPDLQARVDGNNAFAGEFYRAIAEIPGSPGVNLVFSPYSLVSALSMTYAGAAGNTATQMATTLHISQPAGVFHSSSNLLDLELASRDATADDAALHVANGLFLQRDYAVRPEFVDTLSVNYGAPVYLMDNLTMAAAETSRAQINAWVSERTDNKIVDLMPSQSTYLAKLVLANAVLFKGNWQLPFSPNSTEQKAFTLSSGATVNVAMMRQEARLQVAEGNGFTTVSMPYFGGAFEMILMLPDAGQFSNVERLPALVRPTELLVGATQRSVWLSMPRFRVATALSANELLSNLGMRDAFSSGVADFSLITGSRDLLISGVVHQAAIAVDEKGTEASAATAGVAVPDSLPADNITFDRPFLFLITDVATQSVLFLGRVMDPTQQ